MADRNSSARRETGAVISLADARAKKQSTPGSGCGTRPEADAVLSRAFLRAGIDSAGNCKYDIGPVEPRDIPAVLLMLQVMSINLTRQLDEVMQ